MRICYFGTYRANYNRNQIMIAGLRLNGVEVIECHETLWQGVEDRIETTSGGWKKPSFWWRVLMVYVRLIWRYFQTPDHDLVVIGYPGQFDVYLARLLTKLRRKPLVWDVFMSIYLIALERGLDQQSSFTVNWIRRLERWALRLPDLLIQDTAEYVQWLNEIHDTDRNHFRLVPTGADDRISTLPTGRRKQMAIFKLFITAPSFRTMGFNISLRLPKSCRTKRRSSFIWLGMVLTALKLKR